MPDDAPLLSPELVRDAAFPLECRLAYDGTRENVDGGYRVALDFHPNDRPAALLDAPPGTVFLLVAIELDDDSRPRPRGVRVSLGRPGQIYDEMLPAAQVGMLCTKPEFLEFLSLWSGETIDTDDDASDTVCLHCKVNRKREIAPGSAAAERWAELNAQFQHWKLKGSLL